eukprot:TRINITY_DN1982_c0_g1_i2.p1 TRINITY_DN1982_c0_g1~~TRINITY_DN1982_c0_g1_i2.p1  ORF type:complete len:320 (+),score=64.15 TRINITY_DN1982_c0_g1_i2:785-1744(+)
MGNVGRLDTSRFLRNTAAAEDGGAVYFAATPGGSVTVVYATFANNTAGRDGGALFITDMAAAGLHESNVTGNTAGGVGGGVRTSSSQYFSASGVHFDHNRANDGGAVWYGVLEGQHSADAAGFFTDNVAVGEGGGFYVASLGAAWRSISGSNLIDNCAHNGAICGTVEATLACSAAASELCADSCRQDEQECSYYCTTDGSCVYSSANPNATQCLLGKLYTDCSGHGSCMVSGNGGIQCSCDTGYEHTNGYPDQCIPVKSSSSSSGGDDSPDWELLMDVIILGGGGLALAASVVALLACGISYFMKRRRAGEQSQRLLA